MFASGTKGGGGGLTLADLDWQNSVLEIADNTAIPLTEVNGDRYLLDTAGGGVHADWDGAAVNDIVEFNGATWEVTYAASGDEGGACWVEDLDTNYIWDGTTWVAFGSTITHNNTFGLQGGTTDEYYHLTMSQHPEATRDATNIQNGLMPTGKLTGWDAAATHVTSDGSDHSKVGANETAAGLNTTHRGVTSGNPHNVLASEIVMARIAGSTFSSVQHMQDVFHSAGWVSGGSITDDADGTITVAAGTGLIRATDSALAQIIFANWAQESGALVDLADSDINWIYAEYNGGSPRVIATTTERTDYRTNILLAKISRDGTSLHINEAEKHSVGDHANSMILRLRTSSPYGHISGGILSEKGTIKIGVTAGSWWRGLTPFTTAAFDSNAADRFSYWYRQVSDSGWVEVTTQDTIDNARYDDNSGSLASLSNNKYGVHWVYLEVDDHVDIVYGRGNYTLSEAEDAQTPASVPNSIATHGFLVGKIIIKEGTTVFTQIESVNGSTFQGSLATDHNSLISLQGGTTDEYYHMTSAEHTAATRDATNAQNGLMPTGKLTGWDAAATHVTSDGSDHSKVTANETAAGLNTTHRGVSSGNPHSVIPTDLSLVIGTNTQAYGAVLDDFSTLGQVASDGQVIVGTGAGVFDYESGATLRDSIGIGTSDVLTIAGIVVADGGTIGQAAGPLITFNDTGNKLAIMGCNVGIGQLTPLDALHIGPNVSGAANIRVERSTDTGIICAFVAKNDTGNDVAAIYYHSESATEGYVTIRTASSGSEVEAMRIDKNGNTNITGAYKIDGTQVVSNQATAIADATDAGTVITQLNDLLAKCRTHGLIAT